jgi:hypothetical protein
LFSDLEIDNYQDKQGARRQVSEIDMLLSIETINENRQSRVLQNSLLKIFVVILLPQEKPDVEYALV